ncbi:DUF5018-related domain-containing protein [Flavivirga algicola]|uniref:DUF5018 domain-containing protein n=1 Tax=Flavivirga algicola TaxID=2729136 RepID=A0ABX1RWL4_9FLAO|nr:hypothetical protein [Flavivirga algicola]NMH86874.1 hypothetical protein [Flavivirga algicola]
MKNIIKFIPVIILSLVFTSCLKSDLDELPAFEEAEITQFRFEYRWFDESSTQLKVVQIDTESTINGASVDCILTVPDADGDFTTAIKNQVSLSNIVGYADISTAATMAPVGNTPVLGTPGDFSSGNLQYEVTAADGTKKTWTLNIVSFNN